MNWKAEIASGARLERKRYKQLLKLLHQFNEFIHMKTVEIISEICQWISCSTTPTANLNSTNANKA